MTRHNRTTFNQARDIVEHSIEYLRQVRDLLEDACGRPHAERVQMLLKSFEQEQGNLLDALERFHDNAPDKVLDTYAQFSVELPEELSAPEEPLSTLTLTQWLVRLNQHLVTMYEELAEATRVDELRTIFTGMAKQVQAHDRRLSKEYQRFEDL